MNGMGFVETVSSLSQSAPFSTGIENPRIDDGSSLYERILEQHLT